MTIVLYLRNVYKQKRFMKSIKRGKMNKTQKIIVILLVLSMIFSVGSVVISLYSNLQSRSVSSQVVGGGAAGIELSVETSQDRINSGGAG